MQIMLIWLIGLVVFAVGIGILAYFDIINIETSTAILITVIWPLWLLGVVIFLIGWIAMGVRDVIITNFDE